MRTPDTEGTRRLSERVEIVLGEAVTAGLRFPVTVSVVAANRSTSTLVYSMAERLGVQLLCGSVGAEGYLLPVHVLLVDPRHRALLVVVTTTGEHVTLYRPGGDS